MMATFFLRNITALLGHVADQSVFVSTSPILPGPEAMGSIIDRTIIDVDERWVYVDIGQQTCQDGSPRTEQLACIKQYASHSHVLQFFHLQSTVTYLLVDAVLLMHQ